MGDGRRIVINATVDPSGVISGNKDIIKNAESLKAAINGISRDIKSSTSSYATVIQQLVSQTNKLNGQINNAKASAQKLKGVVSDSEIKKMISDLNSYGKQINSAMTKQAKLRADAEANMQAQIANARKQAEAEVKANMYGGNGISDKAWDEMSDSVKNSLLAPYLDDIISKLDRVEDTPAFKSLQFDIDLATEKFNALNEQIAATLQAQEQLSQSSTAGEYNDAEYKALLEAGRQSSSDAFDEWEQFNNSDWDEVEGAAESMNELADAVRNASSAQKEENSWTAEQAEEYRKLREEGEKVSQTEASMLKNALGGGDTDQNWDYLKESKAYDADVFKISQHINEEIAQREAEYERIIEQYNEAAAAAQGELDVQEQMANGEKEKVEPRVVEGDAPDIDTREKNASLLDQTNEALQGASSFLDEYMRKWNQMITVSGMVKNAMASAITPILHPIQAADRAIGTLIVKAGQMASAFARMAGNAALSFLRRLASEAKNAAIQLAKLASNAIHGAFQKLAQGAAAAGRGLLGLVKHNKAADGSFKRGFMTIMKYAFGVRSMYFLFRRLRTAVKEAFTEMAKSSPEVNAAIRGLQTALNGLKGSLASAFAPIFTAVAPALIYLINMLTAAMNALGAFFAALTGQSSFKKAVGGMKAVGGGAGGASKKVKELKKELLGFDELNIIHGNDDNGGGGGGGGGAGSGMRFVDQQIPGGIKDFVDKLKELWNNKEYVKIGKLIADWINKAIAEAKDLITWENVSAKIQEFVDAIAGIIEGLLIYVDWKNIGDTIAEAFRTVTNTIDTFMQKVGVFMLAGSALAAMVNGFFGNKKLWTDIGKTITDSVHSFLAFGQAFLDGFDADEAGRGIRSAILTVKDKLPEIAAEFWELVKTAFNKAGSFVNALLGGGEEQPDLSKYVRPKPITANPKITVNNSIWDDLAENLSTGFNTVIENLTKAIEAQPVGETVTALAGWITELKNGINWEAVGNIIGASFQKALEGIGTAIAAFAGNAETTGTQLGNAINAAIRKVKWTGKGEDTVQGLITNLFKGAIGLVKGLFEKFDTAEFVSSLTGALAGVPWGDIAKDIWDLITEELAKLGNILNTLLGGGVEVKPEVVKPSQKKSGMVPDTGTGTAGGATVNASELFTKISTTVLEAIKWAADNIPWGEIGTKVHDFLWDIDWADIAGRAWDAFLGVIQGAGQLIIGLLFGSDSTLYRGLYGDNSAEKIQQDVERVEQVHVEFQYGDSMRDELLDWISQENFNVDFTLADILGPDWLVFDPNMWENFSEEYQTSLMQAINDAVANATGESNLAETYESLREAGADMAGIIKEGMESGDIDVSEDGENVVLTFEDGTKTQLSKSSEELQKLFEQLGVDSVAGLTTAFGNEQESANTAITEMMDGVVEAANEAVETGSPSKVFEELGNNIVAGLILGLQDLPSKLQTIWDALPEWAQTMFASLGKTLGIDINANTSGGNNGGDSGASNKDTRKNTKASKKETKETQKNTKELKKNTAKRGEVDVNYEGAGFDTSGDKPKLNVCVNFVPGDGSEASEENTNGGLLGWLQSLFDADTIEAKVELIRQGWEDFKTFLSQYGVDENTPIKTLIDLVRNNFTDFMGFLGIDPNSPIAALIKLLLDNAENILDFLGIDPNKPINAVIALLLQKFDSLLDFLGIDENNPIRVLLNLIKNIFDPDAEGVLGMDSKTIEALVKLVKDGFKTFLGFLGIDTDSPTIKAAIKLIKDGFTTFLKFLGLDTDSPVIQTILNLLFGDDSDEEAKEVLGSGDKTIQTFIELVKKGFTTFLKFLGIDTDSPLIQTAIQLIRKGFTSFLNFLGIDTTSPVIQTILNLLFGKDSDDGAKEALNTKDKKIQAFIQLVKDGFTSFLKFLGFNSDTPLIKTAIQLIRDGFTTFLKFLGIDTNNPVIKTLVDLLFGKEDKGAKDALNAENKDVDVSVDLEKGKEDKNAKETLALGGKSTIATVIADIARKAGLKVDSVLGLFGWNKNVTADKPTFAKGVKATSVVNLFDSLRSIIAGKPTLASDVSKTSAVGLFDSIRSIFANKPTFAKGVKATSAVALFKAGRSIFANKPTFAKGVDKDSVVKKFTWGKKVIGTGAVKEKGVAKDAPTTKFTWGKKVIGTGAERKNGVDKDKPTQYFTWGKKVIGTGAKRKDGVAKDAPTTKFTWGKKVIGTGAERKNGVAQNAPTTKFTWSRYVIASGATRGSGVKQSAALDLFTWTKSITITAISIAKSAIDNIKRKIKVAIDSAAGAASGGVIANGRFSPFAEGGVIRNGIARYLDNVPHYAGGTTRAHGTVFVAGEAGPEIMGHINGRTEILNKSQIAEAIYAAVMHGMGAAVNALGKYIANHMTNCTNSIVQTIAANAGLVAGVDYYAPAMATGGIMPYDVAMQIARSTQELQNTLDANNEDLIQAMVSAVGNAAQSIVQAMMTQAARGNMNRPMNTRMVVDDINRTGQMFGQSPIKGV